MNMPYFIYSSVDGHLSFSIFMNNAAVDVQVSVWIYFVSLSACVFVFLFDLNKF